jgi:hypothetical protein
MDIVTQAKDYLAQNAAESGADVLIAALVDEVERLRQLRLEKIADEGIHPDPWAGFAEIDRD